jgi:diadenylate cyclase
VPDWLANLGFLRSYVLPVLDIAILSFLFFKGYQILIQTRAVQLIRGTAVLLLTYGFAYILQLKTLLWVMNLLVPGLVIGLAIIFQPELRKIFTRLGQGQLFRFQTNSQSIAMEEILKAAEGLSILRRGALIVFARSVGLKNIIETGSRLDAEISQSLLMTIFAFDTALHDGAVIIEGGRISSAGSFLPLSEQQDIRKSFGTRHRAALGMAEETDAVVLVVSEETGAISLCHDGAMYYDLDHDEIREKLWDLLHLKGEAVAKREESLEE